METIDAMRPFCDGSTSAHDLRSLMVSMGHSPEDFADAFAALSSLPGSSIRVGRYEKGEYHAEIYLSVQR
jgi:hypothetical protein